ncbi:hypothetical protein [Enterovirga rhinocerotis]|uniref:hypothetical protein n=1 Tax=Enterovirga rhinocerotis TaxID=1339210 RepID=UPI00105C3794|nr:hypothetical protein [Enterovirga rhinocerotis]
MLLGASPSAAHQPYFGRSETVDLPDGRTGEMRIVYGDGIMFSDPSRVVLIGPDGRLLARSRRGRPMSLVCRDRTCLGYDSRSFQSLEPDPTSFLVSGPLVSPNDGQDDIWALDEGTDDVGFSRRIASPLEILRGEFGHAREHARDFLTLILLAFIALSATAARRLSFRRAAGPPRRLLAKGASVVFETIAYIPLVLMLGVAIVFGGLSLLALLVTVCGSFLLAELAGWALDALRRA